MITSRKVEVVEFYCTECGETTGGLVSCPRCSTAERCAKGRHRIMYPPGIVGDIAEVECWYCKAKVRVVLAIAAPGLEAS